MWSNMGKIQLKLFFTHITIRYLKSDYTDMLTIPLNPPTVFSNQYLQITILG